MKIISIKLLPIRLNLKTPFTSAHETVSKRPLTIIEIQDELGNKGLGELEAFNHPYYQSETQVTARWIIKNFLAPLLKNFTFNSPLTVAKKFRAVKGNMQAKAALDTALWDLYAKRQHKTLTQIISKKTGSNIKNLVPVGISLGISNLKQTIKEVKQALNKNYRRIKIKIHGNFDLKRLQIIRNIFPTAPLMADANGSLKFTSKLVRQMDDLKFLMFEDPFPVEDIKENIILQNKLKTPLCLDEPITSAQKAVNAIYLGEGKIISMKTSCIGGLSSAIALIKAHQRFHFPLWCGGMLEGGVGRATNLALASLDEFQFPGDISETDRYYKNDFTKTNFKLRDGCLLFPRNNLFGIGVLLKEKYIKKLKEVQTIL